MMTLSKKTFIIFCILLALATPKFCSFLSDYNLSMREREYQRFQKYHNELNDTSIVDLSNVEKDISTGSFNTIKSYAITTTLCSYDKSVTSTTSRIMKLSSEKKVVKENKKNIKKEDNEKSDFCIDVSDDEIIWMTRCVFAEDLGGTYEDMLATAASIVNRYKETPKSNRAKGMFSIISGNQFANPCYGKTETKNFYNADISKNGLYYKAVISALKGNDPTNGSSYFYNINEISLQESWHEHEEDLVYSGYISPNGHKYFRLKK